MGPESSGDSFTAYIDGQPVEIGQPMQEITLDYAAAITAEAMGNLAADIDGVSITVEVAAEEVQKFFRAIELAAAVDFARVLEPAMAHRYLHTKKKRIRKKYEKRILVWFREVFL